MSKIHKCHICGKKLTASEARRGVTYLCTEHANEADQADANATANYTPAGL